MERGQGQQGLTLPQPVTCACRKVTSQFQYFPQALSTTKPPDPDEAAACTS